MGIFREKSIDSELAELRFAIRDLRDQIHKGDETIWTAISGKQDKKIDSDTLRDGVVWHYYYRFGEEPRKSAVISVADALKALLKHCNLEVKRIEATPERVEIVKKKGK